MDDTQIFLRFGISLVIGVMIGLQREFAFDEPNKELAAGVRTFALISLIGCAGAFVSDLLKSPWPFVCIIFILGIFLSVNYFVESVQGRLGLTSDVSAVLTAMIGAMAYWDHLKLAAALGVVVTVLLSFKPEMHRFAKNLTQTDVYATLKFAVITAVILPVLPNKAFGLPPFDVFNPFKIWLLVIFISGVSFIGYVLIKIVGTDKGIGLTGFLGGLASSTALTLSFTQRSRRYPRLSKSLAMAIIIAWTVMFLRVLAEIAVLNMPLARMIWMPILASVVAGLMYSYYLYWTQQEETRKEKISFMNPFELKPAIKFGAIFTGILLISKAGQVYLGDTGFYITSFVSGLADSDAIALSVAELSRGKTDLTTEARAIILATAANTFAKGGIVMLTGSSELRGIILPGFLLMMLVCVTVVFVI